MSDSEIVRRENTVPTAQTETGALLSVIERVAMSPDADIAKLEKMLDMQERVLDRNARQEFAAAMAALQADLPEVDKLAKGHNTMYAKFEHILAAIKPHLKTHGFAITHRASTEGGAVTVTAVLSHRSGHSEETSIVLPADNSGNKNNVQAIGSSMEYGRRYTMNALLGIATKDADNDGGTPRQPQKPQKQPITDERLAAAITKINAGEYSVQRLNESFNLTAKQKKKVQEECEIGGAK